MTAIVVIMFTIYADDVNLLIADKDVNSLFANKIEIDSSVECSKECGKLKLNVSVHTFPKQMFHEFSSSFTGRTFNTNKIFLLKLISLARKVLNVLSILSYSISRKFSYAS